MKLSTEQKKIAIMAELNLGAKLVDVAEKYDVNPMTIGTWRRKARKDAEKDSIIDLETVPPEVIETVLMEVKEKAKKSENLSPKQYRKLDAQLDNLSNGVSSLQLLDTGFHNTMLNLLEWANDKITDDMKVSEWTALVNGISTLHSNMFGKSANTNVNIIQANNNAGSSAKVEKFKAGFRA